MRGLANRCRDLGVQFDHSVVSHYQSADGFCVVAARRLGIFAFLVSVIKARPSRRVRGVRGRGSGRCCGLPEAVQFKVGDRGGVNNRRFGVDAAYASDCAETDPQRVSVDVTGYLLFLFLSWRASAARRG